LALTASITASIAGITVSRYGSLTTSALSRKPTPPFRSFEHNTSDGRIGILVTIGAGKDTPGQSRH